MTALSAAFNRQKRGISKIISLPLDASAKIYKGGLVAINTSGYAVPGASTTAFIIAGVAVETVDNTSGAAGALRIQVEFGAEFLFVASSITQAMLGTAMFAVDDNTVDETDSDNIFAGILTEYVSTTSGWVFVPGPFEWVDGGRVITTGNQTVVVGDERITAGNLRLGVVSAFGTTEPTSAVVMKTGTAPVGAIATSGGLFSSTTVVRKIIADGTASNVET